MIDEIKELPRIETPSAQRRRKKVAHNTNKATAVGAVSGVGGSVVIAWLSAEGERRYGVPLAVTASVLGTAFTFVARWAAKLLPDD